MQSAHQSAPGNKRLSHHHVTLHLCTATLHCAAQSISRRGIFHLLHWRWIVYSLPRISFKLYLAPNIFHSLSHSSVTEAGRQGTLQIVPRCQLSNYPFPPLVSISFGFLRSSQSDTCDQGGTPVLRPNCVQTKTIASAFCALHIITAQVHTSCT